VSVVATGIEAEASVQPNQGKVFTFPATRSAPVQPVAAAPEPRLEATPDKDEDTLDLGSDEDSEELMLDADDILTSPVTSAPIAPPADDEIADEAASDQPRAARESGTLFERMSNIARGAAKAQVDEPEGPGFRRDPIDIPRFLNRQNNQ
jgi:cell division protein FtsZ